MTTQRAYTKGKSTEAALHEIVAHIEKSLSFTGRQSVAFLDIQSAFNNILPSSVTIALADLDVSLATGDACRPIVKMQADMVGVYASRFVSRRAPQGGVLSPLTWVLAVNQLLRNMAEEGGCNVIASADNLVLVVGGKFPQILCDIMQGKLRKMQGGPTKIAQKSTQAKRSLYYLPKGVRRLKAPTVDGECGTYDK